MVMSWEFIITSVIVVLLPGTGVLYTLAIGLGQGFKASIYAAFGCTLGIIPSAFAAIIGLSAVLHTSAVWFQAVKFFGVIYLFYMAWGLLKDQGPLKLSDDQVQTKTRSIIFSGALLNVLNPKLSLFFLAFLPQFVDINSAQATMHLIALVAIFMVLTFVIFMGYGYSASMARDYVISKPSVIKWLKKSFALSFGLLGLKLAFGSDR